MLLSIALILVGMVMLVFGGEAMLRGAVGLATLLHVTPAVIGLTVVSAATSVPELAVSGLASYDGKPDIAVSNVVGSNIFNITVILGICALVRPLSITGNTMKLEYPVLMLVMLLCLLLAQDGEVNRLEGILLLSLYIGFTAYLLSLVRKQVSVSETNVLKAEVDELTPTTVRPRGMWSLALLTLGVILLAAGAHSMVNGAVSVARLLGWSERLIGLTVVSVGTGLPEVVASLVSNIRGRCDVAISNVLGSSLFNLLGILGVSAFVSPLPVKPEVISSDFWWMLGVTLLLFPVLLNGLKVYRWEGLVLLVIYVIYTSLLLANG